MREFHISEEAAQRIKNPTALKKCFAEGQTFQDILGYPQEVIERFYEAACALFRRELYWEAADAFIFLTTLNPRTYVLWLGLGMAEQKGGRYPAALAAYSVAIAIDPSNPLAHDYSAFCKISLEQIQ